MTRDQQPVLTLFAIGLIGRGVLLVCGPAILAEPTKRLPWTAFFISWVIASAAWVVAQNIAPKQRVPVES